MGHPLKLLFCLALYHEPAYRVVGQAFWMPIVFGVCRRVIGSHHDAEDAFQATFLVLARKAASVRPRERVANWLHGVALRTAMKAKAMTAKRRGREKQVTEMPEPDAAQHDQWLDLQPLLDQELNGLPENYRLPILLCDLEGKTIKDAARQLGWPQGTMAGRLARGRKLLAKRLANRGIVLSAGLLAAVVTKNAASAGVPASLMGSTVKAATMIAAGQAAVAGAVPAKVAILTEGVLKSMLLSKLKTTATVLLVLGMVAFGGVVLTHDGRPGPQARAEQPQAQQAAGKPADTKPLRQREEKIEATKDAPLQAAARQEYAIVSRLMEAGEDQPKKVLDLPKATVNDGQLIPIHITDGPENLLAKVIADEKIKIGTFLDVRVTRLGADKARLFLSFQQNELEKGNVSEVRVVGSSVQTIQDVELHKPAKIVFQKDAKGSALRWVEITVDAITVEKAAPPAAK